MDITVSFQESFCVSFGPKTQEKITVISQVSHFIERGEMIVDGKYIGYMVLVKLYPCYQDVN